MLFDIQKIDELPLGKQVEEHQLYTQAKEARVDSLTSNRDYLAEDVHAYIRAKLESKLATNKDLKNIPAPVLNLIGKKTMRYLVFSFVLLTFSCLAQAQSVQVSQGYVRAVPPTSEVSAAFMQLKNTSGQDLALVAASSPAAKVVELHTHTQVDGVLQMRQIAEIKLPSQTSQELKPGGLHLMLIGLVKPLQVGEKVQLSLELNSGEILELELPVKKGLAGQEHRHEQHQHRHEHKHKQHQHQHQHQH